MPQISQNYFKAAAIFLVLGIAMGLQMSISGEHKVTGAHAHLSLLGWASCAIFGTYFALQSEKATSFIATLQFWLIVTASAVMSGALYLLLLGYASMEPLVALASIAYALGALLFAWIVFAPQTHHSVQGHAHG